jgi:Domain of unknown function (DUF2357)/PD-(D/E)XK nuclease superfamily
MTGATTFSLTRNGLPLAQLELGQGENIGQELLAPIVNELQPCGFQIDNREVDVEYRLWIGDRDPLPAPGSGAVQSVGVARGRMVYWDDAPHFDGARGRVWARLASRPFGSADAPWQPRGRLPVYVAATKLSEARYETMLSQLRRLATGLVFDIVSPMLRQLRIGEGEAGMSHRSSQVELRLLERLWASLSRSLEELVREPATRIERVREVRPAWGGERFGARTTARLASQGVDPRQPGVPRPFPAFQERFLEGLNTVEHQVIAGLLQFLRQRVLTCDEHIRRHVRAIAEDRPFRERLAQEGLSLYEIEDRPRLDGLKDAQARARRLHRQMTQAQSLPLFRGLSPRFSFPATPIFEHVRPYRRIRDEFRGYLRSSLLLLEDGLEERLKSTQRMYEQWVFFQLAGAFRRAGLRCTSQEGLFHRSRRFRYTLDVDRGAQLTFLGSNGRAVVLRFEPWVLPRATALQRGDTLCRGAQGETAWSPDVLIEFLEPTQAEGAAGEVSYVVVVDAKYTARIQDHHWADTRKYLQIRATRTRRQVVKQLWLAYPTDKEQIAPEDSAITWNEQGPDCGPDEVIEGRLGLIPAADQQSKGEDKVGWIGVPEQVAQRFVEGLLRFLNFPRPGETEAGEA